MATASTKTTCFTCSKETETFNCEGCLQSFCHADLTKHFEALDKELDEIENDHYQFRQKLNDQKDDPNKRSLIKEINKWEEDSIEIIKQTADKCRETLTKYTNVSIVIIENKLNDLVEHITQICQENESIEMEVNQLREKFKKLQEELDKPSDISIDEESTSFINRIYVITPDEDEMEITLVGLNDSGKTTFLNVIAPGQNSEDMIPTVGFNLKKITKGDVNIKIWDIGGQPRFRSMWERYCRGVNAIVFMVNLTDHERFLAAKQELSNLLEKPNLQGIPVLVLGNKCDLPNAVKVDELIQILDLESIKDREICCYSISCKEKENIDTTLQWIIQHSKLNSRS